MAKKTYGELLKDPRWQKKRLEIFRRDGWACKICGDDRETLAVHHKKYISGKDPWDYDNSDLMTVCEMCHSVIEITKKRNPEFDLSVARAICLMEQNKDEEYALSIYMNGNGTASFVIKRGDVVKLNNTDIGRLILFLKNKPDGKKVH